MKTNEPTAYDVTNRRTVSQLMQIKDTSLRDKVAAVWNESLTTGCGGKGWTFAEIRAIPFTLLAGKIDLTFVEHLNSCVKQCIAIADILKTVFGDRIPVQRDHLIAGSLLADVGKMLEFDKNATGKVIKGHFGDMLRHPFSGVALCYKHGIPGRGDAHHRHAQPRGRQGRAHDREHHLPPRGLHRLRYRQVSGETRGQEADRSRAEINHGSHAHRENSPRDTPSDSPRERQCAPATSSRSGRKHVMTHDNTGAVIPKFKQIGATKIHDPRAAGVRHRSRHSERHAGESGEVRQDRGVRQAARRRLLPEGTGIAHQVMVEQGYVVPGSMVVGSRFALQSLRRDVLPRHAGRANRRGQHLGDGRDLVAGAAGRQGAC